VASVYFVLVEVMEERKEGLRRDVGFGRFVWSGWEDFCLFLAGGSIDFDFDKITSKK